MAEPTSYTFPLDLTADPAVRPSAVSICNVALSRIGAKRFIAAIGENTPEGKLCELHYPMQRDVLLETHEWDFATPLVTLEGGASTRAGWRYAYPLANAHLKVRRIGTDRPAVPVPSLVEMNPATGVRMLYTDAGTPTATGVTVPVRVTMQITDPDLFSPTFASSLAWLLAAELATPLAASKEKTDKAMQMAEAIRHRSAVLDSNEGEPDVEADCAFIKAR